METNKIVLIVIVISAIICISIGIYIYFNQQILSNLFSSSSSLSNASSNSPAFVSNQSIVTNTSSSLPIVIPNNNRKLKLLRSFDLTYQPPLWSGTYSGQNICCSSNGLYVSLCCSGYIYNSSNYGVSFKPTTFPTVIYSVGMNSTGQYQLACSTGIPSGNIYLSIDYGTTWVMKLVVDENNQGRWLMSICIDKTGQYQYLSGGGGAGERNLYSIDFGNTWNNVGGIFNRISSTMNNNTLSVTSLDTFNNSILTITIENTFTETSTPSPIDNLFRLCSDRSNNIALLGNNNLNLAISLNNGLSYNTVKIPKFFSYIYSDSFFNLYGFSLELLYISINKGLTWISIQLPSPIHCMTTSFDGAIVYLILEDGTFYIY
jgi:hypothetical protein